MCRKLCLSCVCALVPCAEFIMSFGANFAEWKINKENLFHGLSFVCWIEALLQYVSAMLFQTLCTTLSLYVLCHVGDWSNNLHFIYLLEQQIQSIDHVFIPVLAQTTSHQPNTLWGHLTVVLWGIRVISAQWNKYTTHRAVEEKVMLLFSYSPDHLSNTNWYKFKKRLVTQSQLILPQDTLTHLGFCDPEDILLKRYTGTSHTLLFLHMLKYSAFIIVRFLVCRVSPTLSCESLILLITNTRYGHKKKTWLDTTVLSLQTL